MKGILIGIVIMAGTSLAMAQEGTERVSEQDSFHYYSAFWPNLHNLLWAEAWARRPASPSVVSPAGMLSEPLAGNLDPQERAAWSAAVAFYDEHVADLNLLFEMGAIRKAMAATAAAQLPTGLDAQHRQILQAAAPVYRKHWWPSHDRANRAWIVEAMQRVGQLSPAVQDRLVRLYGTPWFARPVRVDVVRVSSREGAYTSIDPAPAHITLSSGSPNNQEWAAAEVLFHEASHALAQPLIAGFTAELNAQGKNGRRGPPESWNANVWHVALFYLTGEVVRQQLAARDVAYLPYAYKTGLLDRVWPQFKPPIETYWRPYVDGRTSREEAIKNVVTAIK